MDNPIMYLSISKYFLLLSLVLLIVSGCMRDVKFSTVWTTTSSSLGTNYSPRCVDLNGDGIHDVVLGSGRAEFETCVKISRYNLTL
jgi:hypothetical protein